MGAPRRAELRLLSAAGCRLLVAALALSAACGGFDPSKPIVLLVGPEWGPQQIQIIGDAADAWNLEVGTKLSVAPTTDQPQHASVRRSKFVCAYASGITEWVGTSTIDICELDARDAILLARVAPHEMGHLLGILGHADNPSALMYAGSSKLERSTFFEDDDLKMFGDANPAFRGPSGCEVVRRIGRSMNRPWVVSTPTGPVALWAEPTALHFARLDLGSAAPAPASSIPTTGTAAFIRTAPTADGFVVLFRDGATLQLARIRAAQASPPRKLDIDVGALGDNILDISFALLGTDLYVAVSEGAITSTQLSPDTSSIELDVRTFWLYRFDPESGARRPFAFTPRPKTRGQIAAMDGAVVAAMVSATTLDDPLELVRFGPGGEQRSSLLLESLSASLGSVLQLHSQRTGILIARSNGFPTLRLERVVLGPTGALARETRAEIQLPGDLELLPTLSLIDVGNDLAISLSAARVFDMGDLWRIWLSSEVNVSLVDGKTLGLRVPWRRLSTPDNSDSVDAVLANDGTGLVAVWRDLAGAKDKPHLVRSRCFSFDAR